MYITKYFTDLIVTATTLLFVGSMVISCKKIAPDSGHEDSNATRDVVEKVQVSKHREHDEKLASEYLERARTAMDERDYDEARRLIKEMRDTCYLALDAREQALLLLDSVELFNAMDDKTQPDHDTRVQFYQKKLEYDRQTPRQHEIKK